jgi:acetyl-CoA C-acetyltransferase
MDEVVIVAALRTPVGKFGGGLAKLPAPELGAQVRRFENDRCPRGAGFGSHTGQVLTAVAARIRRVRP